MSIRKLPLLKSLDASQGSHFSEQIAVGAPGTTVEVVGKSLPPGLRATSHGNSVTISGTPKSTGDYNVTIVEKRVRKITIKVGPPRNVFTTPIMDLITKKRT